MLCSNKWRQSNLSGNSLGREIMIFGNQTGATGLTTNAEATITGAIYKCPANSFIGVLTVYINCTVSAKNMKCAIYRFSDLKLLGSTNQLSIPVSAAWRSFQFPTPQPLLVGGTDYILCVWSAAGTGLANVTYSAGSVNQGQQMALAYDGWPDPLVPSATNNYAYSIYAICLLTGIQKLTVGTSRKLWARNLLDSGIG